MYSNGTFTFNIECEGVKDPTQKLPAKFVENLYKEEMVAAVTYTNYTVTENKATTSTGEDGESITSGKDGKKVTFSLVVDIVGRENPYHAPEETTEETTEGEAE